MKPKLGKRIGVIAFALFFIFLMLFSIVASSFLQSSRTSGVTTTVTLPTSNIVGYELTSDQESYALQQGKTIMKFYYTQTCIECMSQKPFLESIASQFSDQVILEEVINQNERVPTLLVSSYYQQKNLFNATRDDIINSVCDVLIKPPTACAVRNV